MEIPAQVKIGVLAIACAICTIIGAGAAWQVQDWRFSAEISSINENHMAALKAISDAAQLATDQALAETKAAQAANAALDAKFSKEKEDAQKTIDQLRADVLAGKRRLQLNAVCPAGSDTKGGQAGTSGLADGTGPRLTDAAQRDYFTLSERIKDSKAMIDGLQAYVRNVCLK